MARKSIRDLRIENEVAEQRAAEAEARGETTTTKKKKATKRKTTKRKTTTRKTAAKDKSAVRRRLMWGVFNGGMKEEARFEYHEKDQAEEKLEALRAKSKKQLYFMQPVKVPISDPIPGDDDEEAPDDEVAEDDTDTDGEEE